MRTYESSTRSGELDRVRSRSSRSRICRSRLGRSISTPLWTSCSWRLPALTAGDASRKNLCRASERRPSRCPCLRRHRRMWLRTGAATERATRGRLVDRDTRRRRTHLRSANLGPHHPAAEQHAKGAVPAVDAQSGSRQDVLDRVGVVEIDPRLQAGESDGAIHGAGVDVGDPQTSCQSPSRRALADPGRTVDGDQRRTLLRTLLQAGAGHRELRLPVGTGAPDRCGPSIDACRRYRSLPAWRNRRPSASPPSSCARRVPWGVATTKVCRRPPFGGRSCSDSSTRAAPPPPRGAARGAHPASGDLGEIRSPPDVGAAPDGRCAGTSREPAGSCPRAESPATSCWHSPDAPWSPVGERSRTEPSVDRGATPRDGDGRLLLRRLSAHLHAVGLGAARDGDAEPGRRSRRPWSAGSGPRSGSRGDRPETATVGAGAEPGREPFHAPPDRWWW